MNFGLTGTKRQVNRIVATKTLKSHMLGQNNGQY